MRLKVVSTAATLLAVVPGVSLALGLGDIQLKSTLNAPLNAEIELIASPEELATLRAQIASRDTFSRYGLDYPAFLTGITVRPVRLTDGRMVIQLTSTAAMTEPGMVEPVTMVNTTSMNIAIVTPVRNRLFSGYTTAMRVIGRNDRNGDAARQAIPSRMSAL